MMNIKYAGHVNDDSIVCQFFRYDFKKDSDQSWCKCKIIRCFLDMLAV